MRQAIGIVILMIGLTTLGLAESAAEIDDIRLQVDGLSCPFCSLGLEKKLKRVEGMDAVQIHMKQGIAEVQPKTGQPFALAQIRQAVKDAGFTLRQIRLTVTGTVVQEDGAWVLESRGDQSRFLLFDAEHAEAEARPGPTSVALAPERLRELDKAAQTGAAVVIEGLVHEHAGLPPGLLIERLEL